MSIYTSTLTDDINKEISITIEGNEKPSNDSNHVKSLTKALQLLELLSQYPDGLSLTNISKISKINKSTAHRILATFEHSGFVQQNPQNHHYLITNKMLLLSQNIKRPDSIIDIAKPILNQLQEEFNDTVNLASLDGDSISFAYKLEPKDTFIRTKIEIGTKMPLYCTAIGKVLLAQKPIDSWLDYWDRCHNSMVKYTHSTITEKELFINELKQTRDRGYGWDNEENSIGFSCISAPIFDHNGNATYGISMATITSKLNSIGISNVSKSLIYYANQISLELGYKK